MISSLTTGSLMWEFKLTSGAAGSTPGPGSAAVPPPSEHTHTHRFVTIVILVLGVDETEFVSVNVLQGQKVTKQT